MKSFSIVTLFGALLLLGGCGVDPALITRADPVPAGLDLSGNWVQTMSSGVSQPEARDTAVNVFVKTGKVLKISQTDTGLFVSFDRSVVEEYRFGENRMISIGEIEAERASGWAENGYVIETLDDDNALLTDTYRLRNEGESLRRTILLQFRGRVLLDLQFEYERAWE
jgi:hypothetical protein